MAQPFAPLRQDPKSLDRIQDQLKTILNPPPAKWISVASLANGWTTLPNNVGDAGSVNGFPPSVQYINVVGRLWAMRGMVVPGTAAFDRTGTLFALPPGLRTLYEAIYLVPTSAAAGTVILVDNGDVRVANAGGAAAYVSLNGVYWLAEH